jgi:glycosyltransferase involved in cell wall biosynthesis
MILSLFFTRGVSLEVWVNQGLFDREKLIYEEHLKQGNLSKVCWFTYGSNDKILAKQLIQENKLHKKIEIFEMPSFFNIPKIGNYVYSILLPVIYKKEFKKTNILKTNQVDGSWSAVIAKWLYSKPLIVRTGYTLSIFAKKQCVSNIKQLLIEGVERLAYKNADISVVTSKYDKEYLVKKYSIKQKNIKVIHNYIDTSSFKPIASQQHNGKILFVGRLGEQKNLFNLILAISKTNLTLDIYGQGHLKGGLKSLINSINAKVNFMGVVSNKELPAIYNSYEYYILPSYYEGMPKTLLEAMACGCVCIGTDVIGINEVITNGINGYLADSIEEKNLTKSICNAVSMCNDEIVGNAVKHVESNFSLVAICKIENLLFLQFSQIAARL